jgi:hypothetical protein
VNIFVPAEAIFFIGWIKARYLKPQTFRNEMGRLRASAPKSLY